MLQKQRYGPIGYGESPRMPRGNIAVPGIPGNLSASVAYTAKRPYRMDVTYTAVTGNKTPQIGNGGGGYSRW